MEDDNNSTFSTENYDFDHFDNDTEYQQIDNIKYIIHVATCIIISIGLPSTLVTIYALYSLVRKDHVAPIYVINLLITDLFQFCCLIVFETMPEETLNSSSEIVDYIYPCLLLTSICFMVCISLERYLVIAHPLWYRFRRNIKISVAVCVVVWVITPVFYITVDLWVSLTIEKIILSIFHIIPFPLFIFFLVGTLRALSTSVSVSSEEKRRIVGILVLVLLIYVCLFLPITIKFLVEGDEYNENLNALSFIFIRLSPLADLVLYIFIRQDIVDKFLSAACCCKMESNDTDVPTVNVDDI